MSGALVDDIRAPRAISRRAILCGVAPALLTIALAIHRPPVLVQLDNRLYDAMLRAMPASPVGGVVVVEVDERSLAAFGQWPWRRDLIARLITTLRDLGAAAVAFDIVFAEPDRDLSTQSPQQPSSDAVLAGALRDSPVVLGHAFTFGRDDRPSRPCVLHPLALPVVDDGGGPAEPPMFRASGATCALPLLATAAGTSGFLNAVPDSDGVLRRVPLLVEYEGSIYPGLALAAMLRATGTRVVAIRTVNVNTTSLVLDNAVVPLDGRSNLLVRYRGGRRTVPHVSAADVLQAGAPAALVSDAIVFVGATAPGAREVVSTPFGTLFAGVEAQATVADNLIAGDFIARAPHALSAELAAILILGTGLALLVGSIGLARGGAVGALILAALWPSAHWLLALEGQYFSPLFPGLAVIASLAAATIANLVRERRRAVQAVGDKDAARRLMVQSLLSLTDIRDPDTGSHSRRTQSYSRLLAEQLAEDLRFRDYLTPARIDLLSALAPLHDIGKVGVPDHLLNKPGALTADEYREMKKHPDHGLRVILTAQQNARARDDATLAMARDIVYTHHERWDGTGYPRGLEGEQIPVAGRLMAVVDVYDALTSRRQYREAMSHEQALEFIAQRTGTYFDPAVVDALLRVAPVLQRSAATAAPPGFQHSTPG